LTPLEEARLPWSRLLFPRDSQLELLPACSKVRKMQHELVEHYRLKSNSFGEEPVVIADISGLTKDGDGGEMGRKRRDSFLLLTPR